MRPHAAASAGLSGRRTARVMPPTMQARFRRVEHGRSLSVRGEQDKRQKAKDERQKQKAEDASTPSEGAAFSAPVESSDVSHSTPLCLLSSAFCLLFSLLH